MVATRLAKLRQPIFSDRRDEGREFFLSLLSRPGGSVVIYDPLTGALFANNIIPASRINTGSQNPMKYLPEPQFQQADPLAYTNRVDLANLISQSAWFMR